jgi:hypothetical protein
MLHVAKEMANEAETATIMIINKATTSTNNSNDNETLPTIVQ